MLSGAIPKAQQYVNLVDLETSIFYLLGKIWLRYSREPASQSLPKEYPTFRKKRWNKHRYEVMPGEELAKSVAATLLT